MGDEESLECLLHSSKSFKTLNRRNLFNCKPLKVVVSLRVSLQLWSHLNLGKEKDISMPRYV